MDTMAVFGRFCEQAPFAAMTQLIARSWIDEEFPSIFDEHRGRQYEDRQEFRAVATAMADVALGICDNPNQAYRKHQAELRVARSSFYDKLSCTNLAISEAIVRRSGEQATALQRRMKFVPWDGLGKSLDLRPEMLTNSATSKSVSEGDHDGPLAPESP